MLHWELLGQAEFDNVLKRVGRKQMINTCCIGFDIETTNDKATESAYMYIWQLGVDGIAYYGRTWEEFFCALAILREKLKGLLIIGIHNMGFEMSFLLPRLDMAHQIKRLFAKAEREPLEVETVDGFIFRDTHALTNMSLSALAKAYCTTQKLVGDLDYTIARNSTTPLTDTEMRYCENDVVILCEFMQYLHRIYTNEGKRIPMTSTGIVRRMIKERLIGWEYKNACNRVKRLYPRTLQDYDNTMRYLFRGGYCHAQTFICGDIIDDVQSDDLKSAYPAEMAHRLYPMTPFRNIPPHTALEWIERGNAVIMVCEFEDITATTAHVIESKHKCLYYELAEWENGRLYHAERLTVMLTDVDYKIYTMFYKWANMRVVGAKMAVKDFLPDYLLQPLFEVYSEKERIGKLLKQDEDNNDLRQQYQSVKGKLNSFYGMCVARLNLDEAVYENGEWKTVENTDYYSAISNSVLSPYWGIYITAYTRLTVLSAIYALGDKAYYSDTDSVKHKGERAYFEKFNEKMYCINAAMCERYDLDFEVFKKLGIFDSEHPYDKFKTLGAKRYAYIIDGKAACTVAGLPKSTFREYAEKHGAEKALQHFRPNMAFTVSGKNAHKYNGETSANINGEIMHEYGSCYIYSVSFNMTVEHAFLEAITERKKYR